VLISDAEQVEAYHILNGITRKQATHIGFEIKNGISAMSGRSVLPPFRTLVRLTRYRRTAGEGADFHLAVRQAAARGRIIPTSVNSPG